MIAGINWIIISLKRLANMLKGITVYSSSGMPSHKGTGIFADAFIKHFPNIPVEDEEGLHDPELRESFIKRIFVFQQGKDFSGK